MEIGEAWAKARGPRLQRELSRRQALGPAQEWEGEGPHPAQLAGEVRGPVSFGGTGR